MSSSEWHLSHLKQNSRYSIIVQFPEYLYTGEQSQILPVILNEGHSQQILGILELMFCGYKVHLKKVM